MSKIHESHCSALKGRGAYECDCTPVTRPGFAPREAPTEEPSLIIDARKGYDGFVLVTDDERRRPVAFVPLAGWTGDECIANAERLATGWEDGTSLAERLERAPSPLSRLASLLGVAEEGVEGKVEALLRAAQKVVAGWDECPLDESARADIEALRALAALRVPE